MESGERDLQIRVGGSPKLGERVGRGNPKSEGKVGRGNPKLGGIGASKPRGGGQVRPLNELDPKMGRGESRDRRKAGQKKGLEKEAGLIFRSFFKFSVGF